jgi:hypothetical protein
MSDVRVAAVDPAVERLSKSRERDAVLKLRIAQIRGGNRDIAIFAFEGADDKIVFSRWIERARPGLVYEPFVGDGKRTIRALKAVLARDLGNLADNVFFFVDRDYDDLSGFHDEDNVFMTETYSIENYLVSRDLVESILRDEFPCHESPAVRTTIATAFAASYEQFLRASSATNLRLFIARRIGIECAPIRVKAAQLADIEIDHSTDKGADPSELIMLVREPTEEEVEALKPEFADLDSEQRYRGKFAWSFFKTWLDKLHQDYTKGGAWFPGVDRTTKARISEITFGSLASKSALPLGLDAFLAAVH